MNADKAIVVNERGDVLQSLTRKGDKFDVTTGYKVNKDCLQVKTTLSPTGMNDGFKAYMKSDPETVYVYSKGRYFKESPS